MNERSNRKTDITFELKTVENLRRSIKGRTSLFTCTVLFTVYDTIHIDGSMTWYWPMMWHWLMRCHDSIGLKFLYNVDRWRGSISVDKKLCVRYMHIHKITYKQTASLFKLCHCSNCVVKPRTIDWWRGTILSVRNIFNLIAIIYSMYL